MGLLTKDAMVVRNFLNIRALVKAPVSKQAFVYLMVTEGENFARFPTDYDKTLVSLIILYICGSEICFFVQPGRLGRRLEAHYVSTGSLMECLLELRLNLTWLTVAIILLPVGIERWKTTKGAPQFKD